MKELSRNYRKFEKVFFIYFVMMIIVNLIFSSDKSLIDRFATVVSPIFVFSMIFSCYGNILKEAILKSSWESRMKLANGRIRLYEDKFELSKLQIVPLKYFDEYG